MLVVVGIGSRGLCCEFVYQLSNVTYVMSSHVSDTFNRVQVDFVFIYSMESSVIVLQYGGNDLKCKRSISYNIHCLLSLHCLVSHIYGERNISARPF